MLSLVLFAATFLALTVAATIWMIGSVQPRATSQRDDRKSPNRFVVAVLLALFTGLLVIGVSALGNLVGRPDGTVVENPLALGAAIGGGAFVLCIVLALRDSPQAPIRRPVLSYRKGHSELLRHTPASHLIAGTLLSVIGAVIAFWGAACVAIVISRLPEPLPAQLFVVLVFLVATLAGVALTCYGVWLALWSRFSWWPDRWQRGRTALVQHTSVLPATTPEVPYAAESHPQSRHHHQHHR